MIALPRADATPTPASWLEARYALALDLQELEAHLWVRRERVLGEGLAALSEQLSMIASDVRQLAWEIGDPSGVEAMPR